MEKFVILGYRVGEIEAPPVIGMRDSRTLQVSAAVRPVIGHTSRHNPDVRRVGELCLSLDCLGEFRLRCALCKPVIHFFVQSALVGN
jgi:hypothetical protein